MSAAPDQANEGREVFGSRFGVLMTMIGVAVGLGNVWRFPYMVGRFGGAAFVAVYVACALFIGVPALMAEWALARETRRGTVGAFQRGGLPGGRWVGWGLFVVVVAATAYYANVVGWVLYHALAELARPLGYHIDASAILPPDDGFVPRSLHLQMAATATVILAAAVVLLRGLRSGIERASTVIMPLLYLILIVLVVRALTLPGAGAGVSWYLRFDAADITPRVVVAALGQAVFSLSLGGTFMLAYGSYLPAGVSLGRSAIGTAVGDTVAGLLAGLAIIPATLALGMEAGSGPGLLFNTLPRMFEVIPFGWLFGLLFFLGLFGAAYLSSLGAFEVLITGLTDNTRISRTRAVWLLAGVVFLAAIPPMINLKVFIPWDLTFGSGMQTLGALLAAATVGWCFSRSRALAALGGERPVSPFLLWWIRLVIPGAVLFVGLWWFLGQVLGVVRPV